MHDMHNPHDMTSPPRAGRAISTSAANYTAAQDWLTATPDAAVSAAEAEAEAQLRAAERQLQQAWERGEYHNWNGSSSRAYTAAQRTVKEARARLRAAHRASGGADDDGEPSEGRGALAFALLAFLIGGASLAALALYLAAATHGY